MKNQYLITGIVAVLVGGATFYGGMQYQKSKSPTNSVFFRNGQNGIMMQRGERLPGNRMMNRFNVGEVVSVDGQSMTVKYDDGNSKIIILSDKTSISKASVGSKSDLKPGTKVMVLGTSNSDGTETAQNIQINPVTRPN